MDDLSKEGALSTVPSWEPDLFELAVTEKGELYMHGLTDGVASAAQPVCSIFGDYYRGKDLETHEKRKANVCHWSMDSVE